MTDTLRSICEQCTHLQRPQLDFIPAELQRHREIVQRDILELVSAASSEREKTVVILAGSLFEALLYSFIEGQIDYIAARRGSFTFDPGQSLGNYVSFFNRWFSDIMSIPDSVVTYRDLVHINQELQYPVDLCGRAARDMLRLLDNLLGKLSAYVSS
jgi:hypothetical protein